MKGHQRSMSLPQIDEGSDSENSPASPRPSTSTSSHSITNHTTSMHSEQAWRTPYDPLQRPPVLKLYPPRRAIAGPTLDPIPGSPQDISHDGDGTPPDSPNAPTFDLASDASMRRKKLRRLTRKLGEGVPIELVFPSSSNSELDSDEEETPLLETPSSDLNHPFALPLPTIPESLAEDARLRHRNGTADQAPRKSSFTKDAGKRSTRRDAVYVLEGPEEHGLREGAFESLCIGSPVGTTLDTKSKKKGRVEHSGKHAREKQTVCVGVSASAGLDGKGRSRRWVQGPIPFDQIAGSWHMGPW